MFVVLLFATICSVAFCEPIVVVFFSQILVGRNKDRVGKNAFPCWTHNWYGKSTAKLAWSKVGLVLAGNIWPWGAMATHWLLRRFMSMGQNVFPVGSSQAIKVSVRWAWVETRRAFIRLGLLYLQCKLTHSMPLRGRIEFRYWNIPVWNSSRNRFDSSSARVLLLKGGKFLLRTET